ncbi:hypothetical protein AB6735_11655 [Mucilaginibacter sp. RCC_168]|uniref:hypothetical protein n=1 Tax=Mucilaginibacter sp. RCC_168 TaxID=3239221 RepID=UPI0035233CC6
MKRIILLSIFVLFISVCKSQAQSVYQKQTDSVSALVVKYFNERASDKLYALTSKSVHSKFKPNQWKDIFESNFYPYGKIKERKFLKFEMAVGAYRVAFDSGTFLLMTLKIGSDKKIVDLNFNPYKK